MLRPLVYALFIALHNYPSKRIVKRYETTFRSLAESLKEDQQRIRRASAPLPPLGEPHAIAAH